MGLDGLELVMEVEDEFGVELPDSELSQIRTVADLAGLVLARLPRLQGVCPTARMFYAIRRLFTEHAQIARPAVVPAASLDDLFLTKRPHTWRELRRHETKLPRLRPGRTVETILCCTTAIFALVSAVIVGAAWLTYGWWTAIFATMALLILCFVTRSLLTDRLSNRWPEGISTAGDLARIMAPFDASHGSPGQRLLLQVSVLEKVRQMTAEQLGLPLEKVKPSSRFADDLEMD